ncbi:DUF488 domain-containing protein [Oecophyllibacter saccharovorans]|uniref:DUF488 domain-containing protein n=1 Tax=Oecophyllibacter saccharovorans TaxID=2558360 RepID=UPI001144ED24|nr:DUF488 domain-containing protein [Oecophyllibacter saccharovorans]QDH15314.1 DUF488 domain-containing protein [Oecophyllibacter saccharovorans]
MSETSETPFFTVGHSNQSIEAFTELLQQPEVRCTLLVDIRKMPMSRANPQFNGEALKASLAACGISYTRIAALGGLRAKVQGVPPAINDYWTNKSFHRYADYALTDQFHSGLESLLREGGGRRAAIMCAEVLWWRCHRRLVSDYLIAAGQKVFHVLGMGQVTPAQLTPGAVITPDQRVQYPEPGQAPVDEAVLGEIVREASLLLARKQAPGPRAGNPHAGKEYSGTGEEP